MFSLDLVGVVASYAACEAAKSDAKPKSLFSIHSVIGARPCRGITTSADGEQIWTANGQVISVFDGENGSRITSICVVSITRADLVSGVALDSERRGFVSSATDGRISVWKNSDGLQIQHPGHPLPKMKEPTELAMHKDLMFAAAKGNNCIYAFKTSGRSLALSSPLVPRGLALDQSGNVLVTSCAPGDRNCASTRNTASSSRHSMLPLVPFLNEGELYGVHVDREGRIMVGDKLGTVHVFGFVCE